MAIATTSQAGSAAGQAVFGAAIKGHREDQQDSFRLTYVDADKSWLLVLADGMGGHAAGAIASNIAADALVESFRIARAQGNPVPDTLERSLRRANSAIALAQQSDPSHTSGMGTTIVAAYLTGSDIRWISVGDSPLWVFRQGRLIRLNEDHSLRGLTDGRGGLSANLLQSAVMGEPTIPLVDLHTTPERLEPGDLVLISSDGLLTLDENQIAGTLASARDADPELIAWLLLNAVRDRKKANQDNCTLIVARPSAIGAARSERAGMLVRRRRRGLWLAAILAAIAFAIVAAVLFLR